MYSWNLRRMGRGVLGFKRAFWREMVDSSLSRSLRRRAGRVRERSQGVKITERM